jgi:hypothetical protein
MALGELNRLFDNGISDWNDQVLIVKVSQEQRDGSIALGAVPTSSR